MISYHILTRALNFSERSPFHVLHTAVSSAIHGFVAHESYVNVANGAEALAPNDKLLSSRMSLLLQYDLNPLIDLAYCCDGEDQLIKRWNMINEKPNMGVSTQIGAEVRETRRTARQGSDTLLRCRVMGAFIDQIYLKGLGAGASSRRSLRDVADEMGRAGKVYEELIGFLHKSPTADLPACVSALGSSQRTLQRHISAGGLTFTDIRQAVRIGVSKELVRDTARSFTDIALDMGFYDASHFCHAFQHSCGLSPSEYRTLSKVD